MNSILTIQVRVLTQQAMTQLNQLRTAMNRIANTNAGGLGGVANGLNAVGNAATTMGQKLISQGKNIQWTGRQLEYAFTLPIVAAGAAATSFAMKNEAAFTQLKKVYGLFDSGVNDTKKELEALGKTMELLSDKFGVQQAQVIDIAKDWAEAGSAGVGLAKSVQNTLEAMAVGGIDAKTATTGLITVQAAYKLSTDQLRLALAQLDAIQVQSGISFSGMLDVVARAGGVAATAGIDIEHLAAMAAALVPATGSASAAGNGLKTMISRIMAPTKQAAEEMALMGINVNTAAWQAKNGVQRFEALGQAWKGLSSAQKNLAASTLGTRFQINRFDILMDDVASKTGFYQKSLDATSDSTKTLGIYSGQLTTVLSSNPQKLKIMWNILQNALATVIVPMIPTILGLVNRIVQLVTWFAKLDPGTQQFLGVLLLILAALGPVIRYIGAFSTLLGVLFKTVGWVSKQFGELFGAIARGTAGKAPAIAAAQSVGAAHQAAAAQATAAWTGFWTQQNAQVVAMTPVMVAQAQLTGATVAAGAAGGAATTGGAGAAAAASTAATSQAAATAATAAATETEVAWNTATAEIVAGLQAIPIALTGIIEEVNLFVATGMTGFAELAAGPQMLALGMGAVAEAAAAAEVAATQMGTTWVVAVGEIEGAWVVGAQGIIASIYEVESIWDAAVAAIFGTWNAGVAAIAATMAPLALQAGAVAGTTTRAFIDGVVQVERIWTAGTEIIVGNWEDGMARMIAAAEFAASTISTTFAEHVAAIQASWAELEAEQAAAASGVLGIWAGSAEGVERVWVATSAGVEVEMMALPQAAGEASAIVIEENIIAAEAAAAAWAGSAAAQEAEAVAAAVAEADAAAAKAEANAVAAGMSLELWVAASAGQAAAATAAVVETEAAMGTLPAVWAAILGIIETITAAASAVFAAIGTLISAAFMAALLLGIVIVGAKLAPLFEKLLEKLLELAINIAKAIGSVFADMWRNVFSAPQQPKISAGQPGARGQGGVGYVPKPGGSVPYKAMNPYTKKMEFPTKFDATGKPDFTPAPPPKSHVQQYLEDKAKAAAAAPEAPTQAIKPPPKVLDATGKKIVQDFVGLLPQLNTALNDTNASLTQQAQAIENWKTKLDEASQAVKIAAARVEILQLAPDIIPQFDQLVSELGPLHARLDQITTDLQAQKNVVDEWKASLDNADRQLKSAQDQLEILTDKSNAAKDALDAAKQTLDDLANTPIQGMKAMDDQIFANTMETKKLRLAFMQMEDATGTVDDINKKLAELHGEIEKLQGQRDALRAAGAGSDILGPMDQQIAGLQNSVKALEGTGKPLEDMQKQLDSLGRKGEELDLTKSITFDPMLKQIEDVTKAMPEMPFDELYGKIVAQKGVVEDLTGKWKLADDATKAQAQTVKDLTASRDAIKKTYDDENAKLTTLQANYDAVKGSIDTIESSLLGMLDAAKQGAAGMDAWAAAANANFDSVVGNSKIGREGDLADIEAFNKAVQADIEEAGKNIAKIDLSQSMKDMWHTSWQKFIDWLPGAILPSLIGALVVLIAVALSPVELGAAALAALVLLGAVLGPMIWDMMKGAWHWMQDKLWPWITDSLFSMDWVKAVGNWFAGLGDAIWGGMKAAWHWVQDNLPDFLSKMWNAIPWGTIFASLPILGPFIAAFDAIKEHWRGVVNFFIGALNSLIHLINNVTGLVGIPAIPDIPEIGAASGGGGGGAPVGGGGGLTARASLAAGGAILSWNDLLARGGVPSVHVGRGFITSGPRAIVGEGSKKYPEFVIPTDPAHRKNALKLYSQLGGKLMLLGGLIPTSWHDVTSDLGKVGGAISTVGKGAWNLAGKGIKELRKDAVIAAMAGPLGIANQVIGHIPSKWFRDWATGLKNQIYNELKGTPKAFNGAIIRGSSTGTIIRAGERNRSEAIVPLTPDHLGKREMHFHGDLSFPNITDPNDAEQFVKNLEALAH